MDIFFQNILQQKVNLLEHMQISVYGKLGISPVSGGRRAKGHLPGQLEVFASNSKG